MAIEVRNVDKRFDDFVALDDVSITVQDGALTALLGPSGSGKSTLLRIIAGLETPDGGEVLIGGRDVTHSPARTRDVGFVFQHYAPFKHMTVHDNVAFGLSVRKRPKDEIGARVKELLSLVRLDGLAKRYPSQLSGGQLQRMALARALAVQPQVLLLDEPFGALDAQVRAELREWLRRLHDEIHVTTIFVTHDQEEAMEVAQEIVVMNAGRIEQAGPPGELYESPANEFVMSFIGPVNRLGDAFLRPHDIQILPEDDASGEEALVERVVRLGFEVRVELKLHDSREIWAQVTRENAQELELREGQILSVRMPAPRVFAASSGSARPALRA
ncbi:MAG TPA: sulfate ABC transporter ATP-binding protein [Solirubrobacteraceae bacterium]|jgi:sulfate transport system ATP-binding protein|nr:sulfate ABC transporter ATP-binding protein [Solirubrobacteraceae bacterium]